MPPRCLEMTIRLRKTSEIPPSATRTPRNLQRLSQPCFQKVRAFRFHTKNARVKRRFCNRKIRLKRNYFTLIFTSKNIIFTHVDRIKYRLLFHRQ